MSLIKRNQEKRKDGKILFKKIKKQVQGITLIALVVTVIVLLILAGVAINLTVGDNGLFKRAQNATDTWQMASEDELRKLTALEAASNLETYLYEDKNGDSATIPAGFAVSQVEGEKTVSEGLVVIDSNGNEFVWIPVDNINDMVQCSLADGNCIISLQEDENLSLQTLMNEFKQMAESVEKNHGFYIGRYETSLSCRANNAPINANSSDGSRLAIYIK